MKLALEVNIPISRCTLLAVYLEAVIVSCRCPFAIILSWSHEPLCINHWTDKNTSTQVARDVCPGQACQLSVMSSNGETISSATRNAANVNVPPSLNWEWAEALPDVTEFLSSRMCLWNKRNTDIPDWLIAETQCPLIRQFYFRTHPDNNPTPDSQLYFQLQHQS